MKRLDEVFELPVTGVDIQGSDVYYSQSAIEQEIDDMVANAVNHVDDLADALEDLMKWHVKNVDIWHHPVYDSASRAIKNYRGEK